MVGKSFFDWDLKNTKRSFDQRSGVSEQTSCVSNTYTAVVCYCAWIPSAGWGEKCEETRQQHGMNQWPHFFYFNLYSWFGK